jgi:hypothetical protein
MNEDAEDYQAAGLMINGFLGLMKRYGGSSCGRRIPDQYLRGQFIYSQESYWQNNVPVQTNMRGQRNFYDYNMQPAQNYFRNYLMQQNSNMQNFHCRAPHHSYALPPGVRPEPRNGY